MRNGKIVRMTSVKLALLPV